MPTPAESGAAGTDRAARILAAAARLFRERGYHATGIQEIGEAAQVTGPAVYRHFASKEALLVAVVQQGMQRVNDAFHAAVATIDDPDAQLAALIDAGVSITVDQLDITGVYLYERRHVRLPPQHPIRRLDRDNNRLLAAAVRRVRPELPEQQARFMLQSVDGLNLSIEDYRPQLARAPLQRTLSTMILAALRAGPVLSPPAGAPSAGTESPPGQGDSGAAEPPGPAGPARASRREMILSAATGLFRAHGFGGVGVDDIGAAAGIAGPGVYRHFRSKAELLAASFARAGGQLAAGAARALAMPSARESLDALIESHVGLAVDDPDLLAVYLAEGHALAPEQRRAAVREQQGYVGEWVLLYRRCYPGVSDARARTVVHGLVGLVNGYAQGRRRLPAGQARELLLAMARAALAAAAPAAADPPANDR